MPITTWSLTNLQKILGHLSHVFSVPPSEESVQIASEIDEQYFP